MRRFGNALRALLAGAVGAILLPGAALAGPGICDGSVVATEQVSVFAECDARVNDVPVLPGQIVHPGDALIALDVEQVFAHADGTVADVEVEAGQPASGKVLSVAPVSRYSIVCSLSEADDDDPRNMLLRMGQNVYVKCKKDGSHKAIARVISMHGELYTLETLGGELYMGEAVYIYSSDEFERDQRVGIGTVIPVATDDYDAQGCVTRMCVSPGDVVERGQLLYEYLPASGASGGQSPVIVSPASGIISDISADEGARVSKGASVMTIAPLDSLRVSVLLSEEDVQGVEAGDNVSVLLPWQRGEDALPGRVESISPVSEADKAQSKARQQQISEQSSAALQAQAGMQSSAALQAQAGMQGSAALQAQAGMQNSAALQAQAGMQNSASLQAQAGMQNSASLQAQAGMQNNAALQAQYGMQGNAASQAQAVDDTAYYEVLISLSDVSQLRIGMSATVAFADK
ncbi:MAG: HlyD family efflux transporter periplasmic adaptor subunit [Candidatus Fimadaptatus sp.]